MKDPNTKRRWTLRRVALHPLQPSAVGGVNGVVPSEAISVEGGLITASLPLQTCKGDLW